MKSAHTALVCFLALTAPTLVPEGGPLAPAVAHAQDANLVLAREKFIEGVKAYDAARYDEARTLFLQAYALKRHPAVLLNLGQSEIKSNHVEEGGNHLQQFLRESGDATEDQKKAARDGIADAQKKTGFVILIVDADGSELSIDGKSVGKAPLPDPVFVTPGQHKVTASLRGKSTTVDFDAKRATATPVQVTLGIPGETGPAPAPVPSPDPTPMPAPGGFVPAPGPMGPPPGPTGPMGPPPDTGPDVGRRGFFDWYVDKPGAWAITGIAGAGVVLMVGFGIAAGVANSNAGSIEDQIVSELAANPRPADPGFDSDGKPCGDRDDPTAGADHPHYADACQKLRDNLDDYDTDIIGVAVGGAVTGAAAIALVIYYLVDSKRSSTGKAPSLVVTPIVSTTERGLGVVGSF